MARRPAEDRADPRLPAGRELVGAARARAAGQRLPRDQLRPSRLLPVAPADHSEALTRPVTREQRPRFGVDLVRYLRTGFADVVQLPKTFAFAGSSRVPLLANENALTRRASPMRRSASATTRRTWTSPAFPLAQRFQELGVRARRGDSAVRGDRPRRTGPSWSREERWRSTSVRAHAHERRVVLTASWPVAQTRP
jgi:hypothetical protein